jgi:hypothetical protein
VKRAWVYPRYVCIGVTFPRTDGHFYCTFSRIFVLIGVDRPCSISKVLDASINDDLND